MTMQPENTKTFAPSFPNSSTSSHTPNDVFPLVYLFAQQCSWSGIIETEGLILKEIPVNGDVSDSELCACLSKDWCC
ncbi:hypothetical protein CEXT_653101 [Caerostris extrusa]|uniref:Uncharacterized protein n=1 Tax=Caerostris extrusa TaxID=172846 RepID=A0AAV4VCW8_CAEEX|nr:hypothetical protein CEXT_653101 [Caerostris extrusa]